MNRTRAHVRIAVRPLALALALALALPAVPARADAATGIADAPSVAPRTLWSSPPAGNGTRIFIDAGHGGRYSNANHYGLKEKDVNLWLALELRRQLNAQGYATGIDRTTDRALTYSDIPTWHYSSSAGRWYYAKDGQVPLYPPTDDLQARCNMANAFGADVFVAIHCNGAESSRPRGTETWAARDDALGQILSRYVQSAMIAETRMPDRGAGVMSFYVLRWTNMPAILIEAGFLSNPTDARLLRSPTFRARLMRGIATGLRRFLATRPFRALYPRLDGNDPVQVALSASRDGWPSGAPALMIASPSDFRHALGAGPLSSVTSAPLLYTSAGSIDASTAAEIARLAPSRILVLGDEASVSASAAADAAAAAGLGPAAISRLAGADPDGTSVAVAGEVGVASGTVVIASGLFPEDAYSASHYAARLNAPLLVNSSATTLTPPIRDFLVARSAELTRVVFVGRPRSLTATALAGFPNPVRLTVDDRFALNSAILRKVFPAAGPAPLMADIRRPAETLAAQVLAVHQDRPLLLSASRVMSPYTRQWITNFHDRTGPFTIVGGYGQQPTLVDWYIAKADH